MTFYIVLMFVFIFYTVFQSDKNDLTFYMIMIIFLLFGILGKLNDIKNDNN